MRLGGAVALLLLSTGCATTATGPVLSKRDVLQVLADGDAERMPAALVTGRRLGMKDVLRVESPPADIEALWLMLSPRSSEAARGMLSFFSRYRDDTSELDPNLLQYCIEFELSAEFTYLRDRALNGPEPIRSRALAILVSVRDSVEFESVQRTVAAARRITTEPLASALRAELADANLLAYVRAEASTVDGSRDGKWALRVLAAEKRGDLGPEVLGYLGNAANPDYALALVDFFPKVGGPAGVAGLRYLIENAGEDDEPGKVHGLAPMFAMSALFNDLPEERGAEEAACTGLFAKRGDNAVFAATFLEVHGWFSETLEALDRAMAMASRGELDLDAACLEAVHTARVAVAARNATLSTR